MNLVCPKCGSERLEEQKIDRWPDVLFRKMVCNDCRNQFVARYDFTKILPGSMSVEEGSTCARSQTSVGAEMVRRMIAAYERNN